MAKTLGLDIVIGSAVAGAISGFKSVLGEVNTLGGAIEKLNDKKLSILESTPEVKHFTDRLSTLNQTLDNLYKRKKDLQLKKALAKTDEEAKKINEELKVVNKRISALNRQKLNIKEQLKKAKEEAKKTNLEFRALNRTLEKLNHFKLKLQFNQLKREEFKSKIFDTIAIGITASYPVRKAIEFESAMADVVKVANLSESETIKMSKALEKLSTQIPIAADGLASIAASGASLGIAKDKLIDFTKVVAKMSTAFDMSADEAGEAVAKIMNVYSLGLKEATKLGDVLNYLSDNTAAKARDMINVLARIGGTAKMFGLSAKNAAALADAFLAMGKPPEVAATAINALLTKLNTADKQGKNFQAGLKALGLNAIDIKFAIKNDPQKAIMMVLNKIKQFDKQTQMGILTDMFGAEYSDDIALLVAGLDNYKKALKLVSNEQNYNNSMQREFENRSKTTANQLQLLGNALNRIAINLGSVVLPVLKDFAKWGVKVSNAIADFNQKFPIVSEIIGKVAIGLGAFLVVGAGVGYFLTFIIGGITRFRIALTFLSKAIGFNKIEIKLLDLTQKLYNKTILITKANLIGVKNSLKAFSLQTTLVKAKIISLNFAKKAWAITIGLVSKSLNILGGALKFVGRSMLWLGRVFLLNPIGLVITAIAAGAYLIYNNWDKLKSWFGGFWESLKGSFSKGVSVITNIFLHPINTIQAMWNKLIGWIMDKIKWLSDTIGKVKGWFSSLFGGDEEKEKKLTLKPVTEKVKPIVTAAVTTTIATAQPATLKPLQMQTIKPVSVPVNTQQVQRNAQTTAPQTIVYNFNFGDIKVETKDGKIANPEDLKEQLKQIIEDINFEHKQRSLSDVV